MPDHCRVEEAGLGVENGAIEIVHELAREKEVLWGTFPRIPSPESCPSESGAIPAHLIEDRGLKARQNDSLRGAECVDELAYRPCCLGIGTLDFDIDFNPREKVLQDLFEKRNVLPIVEKD